MMTSLVSPLRDIYEAAVRRRILTGFLLLLVVLVVLSLVAPESADITGGIAMLISYLGGGIIGLRKGWKQSGRHRLVWMLIGSGLLSAGLGVLTLVIVELSGLVAPAFGPIDLFFLFTYVGILGGAVMLPDAFTGKHDVVRTVVDGIVGAISVATLIWIFAVRDVVSYFAGGVTVWDRWFGIAYPLLDVLTIIIFVTVLSKKSQYRLDPRLALMAAGAALQVLGDLMYLTSGIGSTFAEAEPRYAIFVAGAAMFMLSANLADLAPRQRDYVLRTGHYLGSAAPYGVALALVTATLVALPSAGFDPTTQLLTAASIAVGTLVVFRQSLSIRENRRHVDQKRDDLVASVSHELRTPLTAVVGFLALINDVDNRPEPEEMDELVSLTLREAQRMSRIVADVMLLTRCAPHDLAFAESPTKVRELIDETIRTIDSADCEIRVDATADLVAELDQGRIQQVLINLIENALRYGRGAIDIVAMSKSGNLVIEVHDNGPGVPRSDQAVIWQRFERGAHRFNSAIPGSGIGLAVVAAIVEGQGGKASYRDSDTLSGACFSFELPNRCIGPAPLRSKDAEDKSPEIVLDVVSDSSSRLARL